MWNDLRVGSEDRHRDAWQVRTLRIILARADAAPAWPLPKGRDELIETLAAAQERLRWRLLVEEGVALTG